MQAARDRYDGAKRNPWDEVECGHHYARAMSSWSLLLAPSGFRWDATTGTLAFAPKVSGENFRCLFTAGTGWGTFEQVRDGDRYTAQITIHEGALALRALQLPLGDAARANVTLDGVVLEANAIGGSFTFAQPVRLGTAQCLHTSS